MIIPSGWSQDAAGAVWMDWLAAIHNALGHGRHDGLGRPDSPWLTTIVGTAGLPHGDIECELAELGYLVLRDTGGKWLSEDNPAVAWVSLDHRLRAWAEVGAQVGGGG